MNTGHLFAGAGGGIYADLILGHKPVFAVENDKYAAAVLKARTVDGWFDGMRVHEQDVRAFDPLEYKGKVDCVHAGFPCQDISVAGNGAGIKGSRSGLWSEVVRVAGILRPRELFLENSPEIVNRGLGVVLGDLASLGYDAKWICLSASAVGAPHLRARWWCLARRSNADSAGQRADPRCRSREKEPEARNNAWGLRQNVPNAARERIQGRWAGGEQEPYPHDEKGVFARGGERGIAAWWEVEPGMGRMVDGLADRGNRIKCLGNGQVPLCAAAAYLILSTMWKGEQVAA